MKYTVLSFNFKGYEPVREPRVTDPNAEYIYVSDKVPEGKSKWRFVEDKDLPGKDPIHDSYFVRYHPWKYAKTDIVIVVDASVQINDSLEPIVAEFIDSGADYAPMLTSYTNDEQKMDVFKNRLRRVDDDEIYRVKQFIDEHNQTFWKGSIGCAFMMLRKTEPVLKLLEDTWSQVLALGKTRLDEVVLHKLLYSAVGVKLFPVSIQIIQSTYMNYCAHGKVEPVPKYQNHDEYYYICNVPVSPRRFSKAIEYPRTYRYKTEAMLLAKHMNAKDMVEWLDWHLSRCGFDRIHVFDNESDIGVKAACLSFGDRVTYELVEGHPRQYKLYDRYVNYQSQAEWIMPIDDDEYLDLGKFKNVAEMLDYYQKKLPHLGMLAIRWRHLFPLDFSKERKGSVLDYCKVENPGLSRQFMKLGDDTIKCIVRRDGPVHYQETWENPAGGHVPKHSCHAYALTCDGHIVNGCGVNGIKIDDERVRLLHCRYKGPDHWARAHGNDNLTVSDCVGHRRIYAGMDLSQLPTP
ncbi:glycosyltransferase family 2 protein [Fibrobacter sp. UWP2]|uniref:glycosyltransferase family 2 protein n=1 Tax=Fibrobacter sp. UWP2 TaxID=1896216 RepID=UPI00091CFF04|nr:glycosyltransferase family 2 protein [Fibrobacter sp. UWP2]SHI34927.1 Glycosyl transferase family 2 [Fibrobacter sp. UWP2]